MGWASQLPISHQAALIQYQGAQAENRAVVGLLWGAEGISGHGWQGCESNAGRQFLLLGT
jgi:hypothetical protein